MWEPPALDTFLSALDRTKITSDIAYKSIQFVNNNTIKNLIRDSKNTNKQFPRIMQYRIKSHETISQKSETTIHLVQKLKLQI